MTDTDRGNPIHVAVVVLLMVGGGWYFLRHYEIAGLDQVSVSPKAGLTEDMQSFVSYSEAPELTFDQQALQPQTSLAVADNPFDATGQAARVPVTAQPNHPRGFENLRIASWALDGFGPTKLANPTARRNLVRVVRDFDIIAIQQVASIERDLIPRLVDAVNEGQRRYDYVMGQPVGPRDRPEQLAFLFDTTKVVVDRRHTFTLPDPDQKFSFQPLVAWFRAAKPPTGQAWTFSLVNVRVDLARAPNEVAALPGVLAAVRRDGRGEDDVILAGLFQADDAYLLPTLGGNSMTAAVRSLPTDIFGRYQTSNLLMQSTSTTEYLGRGGAYDFVRHLELNLAQAETVTSQIPVYAEFSAVEGGL